MAKHTDALLTGESPAQPRRRYLRKSDLLARYSWKAPISIDRAVAAGRLPKPDLYLAGSPLWSQSNLDAHDDAQLKATRPAGRRSAAKPTETSVSATT
jgi:hypothetical protein